MLMSNRGIASTARSNRAMSHMSRLELEHDQLVAPRSEGRRRVPLVHPHDFRLVSSSVVA